MAHSICLKTLFTLGNKNIIFFVSDYFNYPKWLSSYQIKKFGSIFGKFLCNSRDMNNVNF